MIYLKFLFTILVFSSLGNAATLSGYVSFVYHNETLAENIRPPTIFIVSEGKTWNQILKTDSDAYKSLLNMNGHWVEIELGAASDSLPSVRRILESNRIWLDDMLNVFIGNWLGEEFSMRIEKDLAGKFSWTKGDRPPVTLDLSNLAQVPPLDGYIGDLPISFNEATRAFVQAYTGENGLVYELVILTSKNGNFESLVKLRINSLSPQTLTTRSQRMPFLPPFFKGFVALTETQESYLRTAKFQSAEICNQLF